MRMIISGFYVIYRLKENKSAVIIHMRINRDLRWGGEFENGWILDDLLLDYMLVSKTEGSQGLQIFDLSKQSTFLLDKLKADSSNICGAARRDKNSRFGERMFEDEGLKLQFIITHSWTCDTKCRFHVLV